MTAVLAPLYALCVLTLAVWGVHRFALLRAFRRSRWGSGSATVEPVAGELPRVLVQLPIFNERHVVERLLRTVAALDYPRDRWTLQLLDDSDDATTEIAAACIADLRREGVQAVHVRRADRSGFKAGALEHGLELDAQSESGAHPLVAVFDADFVPRPDFLRRLVGEFDDPTVGLVQARWGHLNRDETSLTRAQSTLLDGHFVIEHTARWSAGRFFNFNGTAGIWRRAAIAGGGGWQHDTLTEDLDLSYRAQLAGWRFVYRPDVVAPAEVPGDVLAFKNQQQRWARGSAQVLRKLGHRLVRSDLPLATRLEALAHLTGNIGYPLVLLLALAMPFALDLRGPFGHLVHLIGFLVCTASVIAFYAVSQSAVGRPAERRRFDVPAAVVLGVGMAPSQTLAVARGLLAGTGEFVRTPKRGDRPSAAVYRAASSMLPGFELLFAGWSTLAIWRALELGRYGALPFQLLFAVGFGWVGIASLRAHLGRGRGASPLVDPAPREVSEVELRPRTPDASSAGVDESAPVTADATRV